MSLCHGATFQPSVELLNRAKASILAYPMHWNHVCQAARQVNLGTVKFRDDGGEPMEANPKRRKQDLHLGPQLCADEGSTDVEVIARLLHYMEQRLKISPRQSIQLRTLWPRDLRNQLHHGVEGLHCSECESLLVKKDLEKHRKLQAAVFGNSKMSYPDVQDGHVTLAGLSLGLVTLDQIKQGVAELGQNGAEAVVAWSLYSNEANFGPSPEKVKAWGTTSDFEWVIPDSELPEYWKTSNKREKGMGMCRQTYHLVEENDLRRLGTLATVLQPFGHKEVFIPGTSRLLLPTCVFSLIRKQDGDDTARGSMHATLRTIMPYILNKTTHLAGYERFVRTEDVIASFFAPESCQDGSSPFQRMSRIYLPLLLERGSKGDDCPDITHVDAILEATSFSECWPPCIFVAEDLAKQGLHYEGSRKICGRSPREPLTQEAKTEIANTRKFIKDAYMKSSIFRKFCECHGMNVDCAFLDEHPYYAAALTSRS